MLVAAIAGAVVFAPLAAAGLSAAGWRFPFPRIFDRTVMATLLVAVLWAARDLELGPLLSRGFRHPPAPSIAGAIRGAGVAACALAILFALALAAGGGIGDGRGAAALISRYLLSAIVVGFIEEGFFRALVLGGMEGDFGQRGALILSAAIYAAAHLVRSPERFYVAGYEPRAGLITLAHSVDQFADPATAIPMLIGLFLLGLVLGEAFILTGSVYFSIGLHGGFVLGAKMWPKLIVNRAAIPWWVAGGGGIPMIGGAVAWAIAISVLVMIRPISGAGRGGA